MGSQEVLGQAARLASSGLLLQVLSFWPAPCRPAAGIRGDPAWGRRCQCGYRHGGVLQEVATETGHLGPELGACVSPVWEIANKPLSFENDCSYMAAGESEIRCQGPPVVL